MLLSVCILMKDEVDSLRRIAGTVRGLADEIIIVHDAPVSVAFEAAAAECQARMVLHRWQNDFAAARNAGLRAAAGEWVFWIDSDETPVFPDAAVFHKLLERADILGYYVTIEDRFDAATMTPSQHLRLYRKRAEIQYTGRIHEHFNESLEALAARHGLKVSPSPVRLSHTGYLPEKRQQKLERNIALLELELADRPGQIYYLIQLGRSLLTNGQSRGHEVLAEAAQVLRPALRQPQSPNPLVAALLEYVLGHATMDFPMTREVAAEAAARWFPSSPPLMWLAARWHYEQGRFFDAARLLEQVLEMGEKKVYDNTISFDQRIFGDETRLNFGVCCAKLGRIKKAREQLNLIKAGSPLYPMARENLKHLGRG
jgi:tetratricopeptide (TPR) repeat protein